MSERQYVPGDTAVKLHVHVVDNATPGNNPVTGLTAHASIRRTSDDKWWDNVALAWDTVAYGSLGAEHKINLPDLEDGSYETTWNQATADASAERTYVVVYRVTAGVGWVGAEGQDILVPGANALALNAASVVDLIETSFAAYETTAAATGTRLVDFLVAIRALLLGKMAGNATSKTFTESTGATEIVKLDNIAADYSTRDEASVP